MKRKWMIKIGSTILVLALISGCNTTNDNNDDVNVPQDTNAPGNDNPNFENTRYNNQNIDAPDNGGKYHRKQDEGIQKKSHW